MSMKGFLNYEFCGTLAFDPEYGETPTGRAYLRMRIVVDSAFRTKEDKWETETSWVSLTLFGERANGLVKVLTKGCTVFARGPLRLREWKDKEGNDRRDWTFMPGFGNESFVITGFAKSKNKRIDPEDEPPPDDDLPASRTQKDDTAPGAPPRAAGSKSAAADTEPPPAPFDDDVTEIDEDQLPF